MIRVSDLLTKVFFFFFLYCAYCDLSFWFLYEQPIPAPDSAWQHDMFADQAVGYAAPAARPSAIETGTKLYISNLDYGVSNEDIKV